MAQQMYGKNREEPYAPSYGGYGQGSNLVPKVPSIVETKQSQKKPVFINYYPSGNTNNPQKVIAQVETVTSREVVRNPVTVIEPVKETRHHHGDGGQLKREDEFINKLRDETIKATADINGASRIIEPKVLSTNLDQLQLSEQPRNRHGTMNDGWIEPSNSADPNHPRKVAELMSRVSNWRGVNGSDYRGPKPISDGYDSVNGYGYNKPGYGNSRDNSNINNGWNKLPNETQGYDQMGYGVDPNRISPGYGRSDQMVYGNRGRRADDDVYTRRNDVINLQAPRAPLTQQGGYDVTQRNQMTSNMNGNHGGRYDTNQETPRGTTYGNGYNSGMGNQLGYGQVDKAGEYGQVYGNGYNSGLSRSNYVGRPEPVGTSTSSTTVISSVDAVTKYKGAFIPLMKPEEQRKQNVVLKI